MKYILNEGRYARAFVIEKANGALKREVRIELDRLRRYTDTGNIATTGITAIEDDDYALLEKNEAFAKMLKDPKSGLSLVDESRVTGNVDKRASELEEENKKLREQLKEAEKKAETNKDEEAVQKIKDENAKLKAKLEALTKKGKKADKDEQSEDEGF